MGSGWIQCLCLCGTSWVCGPWFIVCYCFPLVEGRRTSTYLFCFTTLTLGLYLLILDNNPHICSSEGRAPAWPFLTFSFFGGVYALLPYFVLWSPPSPPVEEAELRRWPFNFLESKITAGVTLSTLHSPLKMAIISSSKKFLIFYLYDLPPPNGALNPWPIFSGRCVCWCPVLQHNVICLLNNFLCSEKLQL